MIGWLTPLDRKLARDFRHNLGPVLAIALVIAAGLATMVTASSAMISLQETQQAYYERNRFADVFAHVRRAPAAVADRIAAIDGVARVEARVVQDALLDIPAMSEPVRGLIISWPADGQPSVNAVTVDRGRPPQPGRSDEVMVTASFAAAHGFALGDRISANIRGTRRDLQLVGIARSPEYIFAVAPGSFVPDDRLFGVFWMGQEAVAALADMQGAFNDVVVQLRRELSTMQAIDRVDAILAPYGGTGAFGRDDQTSHAFLDSELNELTVMATTIPPVFLAVAAFLLNLVVGRLIDTEREQIGLLKSFGYSNAAIGWHYTKFVLLIGLIGVAVGIAAGAYLGRLLTGLYTQFFDFPFLAYRLDLQVVALAVLASMGAALAGAALAVRRGVRIAPAVAMRPPPPAAYRKTLVDRLGLTWMMGTGGRMVVRSIVRRPLRAGLTSLGIAFSVALLISTLFMLDSLDRMLSLFFEDTQFQDVSVALVEARGEAVRYELAGLPGVLAVDLTRTVPVRLINRARQERVGVIGRDPDARLTRIMDDRGREVALPDQGLVLGNSLADDLGARVGDRVRMEVLDGRRPTLDVPVTLITREYVGTNAYMNRLALSRLMGDPPSANGADLRVDMSQVDALFDALRDRPMILAASRQEVGLQRFRELLDESIVVSVLFYVGFGSVIAIGVVYNAARIALAERGREMASMRVLGYRRREVAHLLIGELAVLVLVALPVGWLLGTGMARLLVTQFGSDLFRLPFLIEASTYAYASLVVVLASIVAAMIVVRRVRRLDLIAVLKTRE